MYLRGHASPAGIDSIAAEAVATVERWLGVTGVETPSAEAKLARLLRGEDGARFAIDMLEQVIRPPDPAVAAKNLDRLSRRLPEHTNLFAAIGTHFAGGFAPLLPSAIVPAVRERFLRSVSHLLLRGDSEEVERQLTALTEPGGIRPVVAPLAAVASGLRERTRYVAEAQELLRRPGVGALSLMPAGFLGRPRLLDLEAEAEAAAELLDPLYDTAARFDHPKAINLDVAVLEELEITLRIFEGMMGRHPQSDMAISLPACLPESSPALARITDLALKRRAAGGATATVRLTGGERWSEERAAAGRNGGVPAPFADRRETDAHFLRLLDYALTSERAAALRVVSATHNLFTAAAAWRLARSRGLERSLEHEFMMGVSTAHTNVVKRDVGGVRLFTPVVSGGQTPLAIPYLKRRLGELSHADGFLASFSRINGSGAFESERDSFRASVRLSSTMATAAHRAQAAVRTDVADFTVETTREWASAVLERTRDSASGESLLARSMIGTGQELDHLVADAIAHGQSWGERRGSTRATVLDSVADVLAEWRGLLVETAVSESGTTLAEADADVTVAIESARRAAAGARELDRIRGASFQPPRLVVVVSPRSVPLASLAEGVLGALGAGGSVIIKTAQETRRSSAVFVEALAASGVPPGLVRILDDEGELARLLLSDGRADHILHTGSRHAAKRFHSWRAESRISSTTGGRNCVIVTPSADLESAVFDLVDSAFDHAGQSPLATGTVILVGSVGDSARFLGRLADAIASIPVAVPGTPGAGISALARAATASQRLTLETLDDGESWRVQPRQVDTRGRLWKPGLRDHVAEGSRFHKAENRAPVLGIIRTGTLADAIRIQNAQRFGLAAGLYSLDENDVDEWLGAAEAGLLSVNCSPTTAARSRAPVQGWNRSVVGTVSTGGHDTVLTLGAWHPVPIEMGSTVTLEGISGPVADVIAAAQSAMDFAEFDWVRASALSDDEAWNTVYATKTLVSTEFEQIEHAYRPVPVTVRLSEGAPVVQLVRVLAAAARTQSAVAISSAVPLHADLIALFQHWESPVGVAEVLIESDVRWRARVQAGEIATSRIRLIGGDRDVLSRVLHGQLGIAVHASEVTASGRVELLPFLRGQTVWINAEA